MAKIGAYACFKYHIDASYAIHLGMKKRTRESLSMEVGTPHASSINQKLNFKISTE